MQTSDGGAVDVGALGVSVLTLAARARILGVPLGAVFVFGAVQHAFCVGIKMITPIHCEVLNKVATKID